LYHSLTLLKPHPQPISTLIPYTTLFRSRVTKKNEKMFNSSGHIYVYSMHGHNCMNFPTREKEYPEGVLIRGIEPNIGKDVMARRRGRANDLTHGPGKLTKALGIKRDLHNGMELHNGILTLVEGKIPAVIGATRRIGIDTKEEAVDFPYRFIVKGNPHISRFKGRASEDKGWKH